MTAAVDPRIYSDIIKDEDILWQHVQVENQQEHASFGEEAKKKELSVISAYQRKWLNGASKSWWNKSSPENYFCWVRKYWPTFVVEFNYF